MLVHVAATTDNAGMDAFKAFDVIRDALVLSSVALILDFCPDVNK